MGKYEQKLNFKLYSEISILSNLIGVKLEALEFEFNLDLLDEGNRKVDILAKDIESKKYVFIESQLTVADEKHFIEMKKLLNSEYSTNSLFLWIAESFDNVWLDELKYEILKKQKSISVYFVRLSSRVISKLYNLSTLDNCVLHEIDTKINLSSDDFVLVNTFMNNNHLELDDLQLKSIYPKRHLNANVIERILTRMRKISNFMSIHYYKDLSKHRISIGMGKDLFSANVGISNHRNTIYFSIVCPTESEYFNLIKLKLQLDEQLNYLLRYDKENKKIFFEIPNDFGCREYLFDFIAHSAVKLIEIVYLYSNNGK